MRKPIMMTYSTSTNMPMKKILLLSVGLLLFVSCGQTANGKDAVATADTAMHSEAEETEDTTVSRLTIFKDGNKELIIERDTSVMSYCYAVEDGVKRKLVFGHEYLDDGGAEFTYHAYDRYVYIVGDFKPCSNGWVCRYPLFRIDKKDLSLKFIHAGAAIRFNADEIVVADARLTNPGAECTADEEWVMHDVHFDVDGRRIREDQSEYDYREMELRYGENLVNGVGFEK